MRKSLLICLALLLFSPAVCAQERSGAARQPTLEEIKRKRILYVARGMEKTRARKGLTYKKVGGLELKADVYSPSRPRRAKSPAVIFVPGDGPWEIIKDIKDWGVFVSYGQLVASEGFVGVTFNHRSTERFARVRDAAGDVDDLIAYVRDRADELNVDKERVCLWVFSVGGPFLRRVLDEKPGFVRCIVTYYSMFAPPEGAAPEEVTREFKVAGYLGKDRSRVPPMLMVRAGQDAPFINRSADEFLREAVAQNVNLEFVNYVEGRHAFDVEDDTARTREIIKRTLDFVKRHLR